MVLGSVVAKVSGKPLGRFVKEQILGRSMAHSAFEPGEEMKVKRGATRRLPWVRSSSRSLRLAAGCMPQGECGRRPPTWRGGTWRCWTAGF